MFFFFIHADAFEFEGVYFLWKSQLATPPDTFLRVTIDNQTVFGGQFPSNTLLVDDIRGTFQVMGVEVQTPVSFGWENFYGFAVFMTHGLMTNESWKCTMEPQSNDSAYMFA